MAKTLRSLALPEIPDLRAALPHTTSPLSCR